MRDAAGQPAHGFHLLRLLELDLRPAQGILGPSPFTELPDLQADVRHHLEQLLVRFADLPAIEFDDALDFRPHADRKPEGAVKPDFRGGVRTREVGFSYHIGDPGRLARLPHTTRQSRSDRKGVLPGGEDEFIRIKSRRLPQFQAA
mgnify:CR=1 FL=1